LLQAKLESTLTIQQDDARKRQEQTQKELKIILSRWAKVQVANIVIVPQITVLYCL